MLSDSRKYFGTVIKLECVKNGAENIKVIETLLKLTMTDPADFTYRNIKTKPPAINSQTLKWQV